MRVYVRVGLCVQSCSFNTWYTCVLIYVHVGVSDTKPVLPEHLKEEFPTLDEQHKDGTRKDYPQGENPVITKNEAYTDDGRYTGGTRRHHRGVG